MNTKNLFFILLAISLAGCELGQEPDPARDLIKIDEVRAVLNNELLRGSL